MQLEGQPPDPEGAECNKDGHCKLRASDLRPDISAQIDQRLVTHSPLLGHCVAEALHGRILHAREGRDEDITDADGEQQDVVLVAHSVEGE